MDLEKLFHDLESNQNYESEEAKKKLVEHFTQSKLLCMRMFNSRPILFQISEQ